MKLDAKTAKTAHKRKMTLRNYWDNVFTSSVLNLTKFFCFFGRRLWGHWDLNRSAATVHHTHAVAAARKQKRRRRHAAAPTFFHDMCELRSASWMFPIHHWRRDVTVTRQTAEMQLFQQKKIKKKKTWEPQLLKHLWSDWVLLHSYWHSALLSCCNQRALLNKVWGRVQIKLDVQPSPRMKSCRKSGLLTPPSSPLNPPTPHPPSLLLKHHWVPGSWCPSKFKTRLETIHSFGFFIIRSGRFGEASAAASQVVTFIQLLNMMYNNPFAWWENDGKVGWVTLS